MGLKLASVFQTELRLRGFSFTQEQAIEILRALADTVADFFRAGEKVHIHGIGTFYTQHRDSSEFYSNIAKKMVVAKERNNVKFKPSTALMRAANEKAE